MPHVNGETPKALVFASGNCQGLGIPPGYPNLLEPPKMPCRQHGWSKTGMMTPTVWRGESPGKEAPGPVPLQGRSHPCFAAHQATQMSEVPC